MDFFFYWSHFLFFYFEVKNWRFFYLLLFWFPLDLFNFSSILCLRTTWDRCMFLNMWKDFIKSRTFSTICFKVFLRVIPPVHLFYSHLSPWTLPKHGRPKFFASSEHYSLHLHAFIYPNTILKTYLLARWLDFFAWNTRRFFFNPNGNS